MDDSFQAAMNGLVAADAARMSGRAFADARGSGVARRVRTRRTVRAAGVGGASAVAVGAVALGATYLPGHETTTPGVWPGGCTPTPIADVGAIWSVPAVPRAHVIDASEGKDKEAWYLYDDNLDMVVLQMVPTTFGLEVTFADGTRQLVQSESTIGPYVFEAPGGGWVTFDPTDTVHHAMWHADAPADPSPIRVEDAVAPPFAWQWTGCALEGPSAGVDANGSSEPNPSPDPSLSAAPVVASPFECGFAFDAESSDAPHLTVTATAWNTPRDGMSAGDNGVDASWSAVASDQSLSAVHGVVRATVGSDQPGYESLAPTLVNGMDPADPTRTTNTADSSIVGASFVDVRDGVVVGTMSVAGGDATRTASAILNDHQFASTLLTPQTAFKACADAAPSDGSVDVYFVAGAIVTGSRGSDVTAGPEYAWAWIGTFSSNGSSVSVPTN